MDKRQHLERELLRRESARRSLESFLELKWERYNKMPFLRGWHISYLCKILELTLPKIAQKQATQPLLRLMINMPPSYGKTEIIARTFIAWALGLDKTRKFIYISYSDELCRKISNQVRDLLKSSFFKSIFGDIYFLQDNANEFVLKEGGGLFVTTLKSAITGFHAHQILIDDPIKVSAMNSRTERNLVNQNFKESVLSRLQNQESNITILMQRLGDEDLCGFLLSEKNFEKKIIDEWKIIKLRALESNAITHTIADFTHTQEPQTPLFPARHSLQDLQNLKLQMGNDEFSTQYLQEPQVSESGFFEREHFKYIVSYELNRHYEYIFVDNAQSLNAKADNRAIVCIALDSINGANRYCVKDCVYGIWEESETCAQIINLMLAYPSAKVFIESDGGGLTLERILHQEIIKANTQLKNKGLPPIKNTINVYTPSRKISKVDKIKALKPFYNTGYLCFLQSARGLGQIKKELFSFNPEKPFRKDDCIDCIASAVAHEEVRPPNANTQSASIRPTSGIEKLRKSHTSHFWRV